MVTLIHPPSSTPQGRRRLHQGRRREPPRPWICRLPPALLLHKHPETFSSSLLASPWSPLVFSSSSHLVSPRFKGLEDLLVVCPWDDSLLAIRVSSMMWNQFCANFRAKPCLLCLTSGSPESPVLTPRRLWSLRPFKVGDSGVRDRRLRCRSNLSHFGSTRCYSLSSGHVFDSSLATSCPSLSQVAVQVVIVNVSLGGILLTTTRPRIAMWRDKVLLRLRGMH
jgi:hypothetical protein